MTQVQNELFTELTQEQSATVEGGLFLLIESMQAIRASADFIGADDTYVTVDGSRLWGESKFSSGQFRHVNRGLSVGGDSARVELFDADGWLNPDDSMGGFTATNTNGALRRVRVSGGDSIYDVYYRSFS